MPRKMPFRPNADISQTYNDGSVEIFAARDGAAAGYQPVILATKKYRLNYASQFLGINRLYAGRQNHVEIELLIRVPRLDITPQDLARTHDGRWYSIHTVQTAKDVFPASLDLSLVAVTQNVEETNDVDG